MKALYIEKYGGPEVMQLGELPEPTPAAGEVLVDVHAAGLNPVDFKTREGMVRQVIAYEMPLILGQECAGVVRAVGEGVDRFSVGDEVYTRVEIEHIGTLAESVAVAEHAVAKKPATCSMVEAAGVPLVTLTAWQALFDDGNLGAGDKVLIQAGAGGVGSIAIQLAKRAGAHVATTCSGRNIEFVRDLGADVVINYREQRFDEVLSDYDLVLDTLGGDELERAFTIVRPGGRIVSLSGDPDADFARKMGLGWIKTQAIKFMARKTLRRAHEHDVEYIYRFMDPDGAGLADIATMVDAGELTPIVDRVFDFDQVAEAFAYLETGRARGKVIVKIR